MDISLFYPFDIVNDQVNSIFLTLEMGRLGSYPFLTFSCDCDGVSLKIYFFSLENHKMNLFSYHVIGDEAEIQCRSLSEVNLFKKIAVKNQHDYGEKKH